MWRHQFRTHCHRDSTGNRTTNDTARQNAHRVTCSEWNSPFGDKTQAQYQRCFAAFLLRFIELTTGNDCRQAKCQRRHHTCRHDRRHRRIGLGTQQANAESIRRLVNRTTHIGTHHAAKNRSKQHRIRRTHGLQPVGQTFQNASHRFADQVNHGQTNHQA